MTTTAADLTPQFLTGALKEVSRGATVTGVDASLVGTGQLGECLRLRLTYDSDGAGPASLVAKLPSTDESSRSTAAVVRAYEIEVSFYRDLRDGLTVRTPTCYHATFDPASNDFVLLLEDITDAAQGDQLAGCDVDHAAAAVAQLPGLHAPRWGDTSLERVAWLHPVVDPDSPGFSDLVRLVHPGFLERYADRLDPDVITLSEDVVARLDELDADRPGPWTVSHRDFRLDNLLFRNDPRDPVVVVDWQTCGYGPGVSDLSYFIGGSLQPADRRTHEVDLVRDYHQRMEAAGVALSWDDLWLQYRRYSVAGLIMAIAASMLVKRTDRGDEMFLVMAERAGRHALDLEAPVRTSTP